MARTLLLIGTLSAACSHASAPTPAPASALTPPPAPPAAAARIEGVPVAQDELDRHQARTGLARREALEDLVDLVLLRAAAAQAGLAAPALDATADVRAIAEYELARQRGLEVPVATDVVVVDHAWIKDAPRPKAQAAQRATIEKLRAMVVAGETIPVAFPKLKVDGKPWHIGDHEEYPYEVVPAEAHDLPLGGLSPVIPGDGGLHLFTIHARKRTLPPADVVRTALRGSLRTGKAIELTPQP